VRANGKREGNCCCCCLLLLLLLLLPLLLLLLLLLFFFLSPHRIMDASRRGVKVPGHVANQRRSLCGTEKITVTWLTTHERAR